MKSARALPRLWPIVSAAFGPTALAYVVVAWWAPVPALAEWPFGLAMLVGGLVALRTAERLYQREAVLFDDEGLTDLHTGVRLRWDALSRIELMLVHLDLGEGRQLLTRVASLTGSAGHVRLADLGPGFAGRAGPIANLPSAGLILAVAAARSGAALGPPSWESGERAGGPEVVVAAPSAQARAGLAALGVKLVPKLLGVAVKLAKTIKPGAALATLGVYSLLWSWQAALALMVMVAVHECGHVYAMWRSGVEVRGIYLIPFFGGAAVSKGIAGSQANSAYIAINGPVWGGALAALCLLGWWATGSQVLGMMAGWGALLNLFNLLPLYPLDGGRLLGSLAHAGFGAVGSMVVLGSIGLSATAGYLLGFELLTLAALLGLGEWGSSVAAAPYRVGIELLDGRPFGVDEHAWFHDQVRVVELGSALPEAVAERREGHLHALAQATQADMTPAQGWLVLGSYLGLALALSWVLWVASGVEGAGLALEVLR